MVLRTFQGSDFRYLVDTLGMGCPMRDNPMIAGQHVAKDGVHSRAI